MAQNPPITVWPILHYDDTTTALRFLVDVLGFREALVSRDHAGEVVHAELRWPAGGTILFGSARHTHSVHGRLRPGQAAMYVPTDQVDAVYQRARDAGAEVVQPPTSTQFGSGSDAYAFTLSDSEGYLWTFGSYAGAA